MGNIILLAQRRLPTGVPLCRTKQNSTVHKMLYLNNQDGFISKTKTLERDSRSHDIVLVQ